MNAIEIKNLTKKFKDKVAVNNINLEVNKEFIRKFNAELFLNIVSTPACGNDLGEFDKILSKLTQLLNENKKHKFINQIDELFKIEIENAYSI